MTEETGYWIDVGYGIGYFVQKDLVSEKERVVNAYTRADITDAFSVDDAKHSKGYKPKEIMGEYECDCGETIKILIIPNTWPECSKCGNRMDFIGKIDD